VLIFALFIVKIRKMSKKATRKKNDFFLIQYLPIYNKNGSLRIGCVSDWGQFFHEISYCHLIVSMLINTFTSAQ
jgi:hypothetical protein